MSLILYKDCMLRSTYQEIIRSDLLEDYLDTLTYVKVLPAQYAYFPDDGSFVVTTLQNVLTGDYVTQTYNYGKLTRDDNYSFYFFIQNIRNLNGAVRINYIVDVWATFGDNISWHRSALERCSAIAPGSDGIPQTYEMKKITLQSPTWIASSSYRNGTYFLVIKMQLYDLASDGEYSYRKQIMAITEANSYSAEECILILENLLLGQGIAKAYTFEKDTVVTSTDQHYYEILQCWVMDDYNYNSTYSNMTDSIGILLSDVDSSLQDLALYAIGEYGAPTFTISRTYSVSFEHNNSTVLKYSAFGLPAVNVPVSQTGLSLQFQVVWRFNPLEFEVTMDVESERYVFTDCFEVDIPWLNDTASEMFQLRQTKLMSTISSVIGIGAGLATSATGVITSVSTGGIAGVGQVVSGGTNIVNSIMNLSASLSERYSSSRSTTTTTSLAFYNISLFPALCYVYPANETEIAKYISCVGYSTITFVESLDDIISDDSEWTNWTDDFIYVKFSEVNIYGGTTNENLDTIANIFLNGTRIYTAIPS